ncbi:YncE family protein [Paracoccus sp. MKU1]|uniref:YncE family protein n=1 Tax=Paracoccus sp. MKU1 TaxID=1745182 RepID=UPI0007193443|nr:hypothetical protein [Paracoccus sp. MKU1]KRW93129.1 hypothetical protein AQY21_26915 [Paracoccus sp. MKU1]
MDDTFLRLSRRIALAVLCMLPAPLLAEAPLVPVSDYAGQVVRQDIVPGAYEIAHAPELGLIFVASSPALDDGAMGAVYALDDKDLRLVRRIELPDRAFALAMDHGTGRLFVGHTLSGTISILDAKSGLTLDHVQLGKTDAEGKTEHIRMIEVDETSGRVFVSSPSRSGTVWIVDTHNGNAVRRVEDVGLWAAGLAHDAERSRLYVSGGGIEEIAVLDGTTGDRVAAISTGDTTNPGAEASQHFLLNLALDPEGRLFATDASTGKLYVFDTETGGPIASVPVGKGILDTLFNPRRNEVYVTWRGAGHEDHQGTGGLAVIDGTTLELRHRIDLPIHPNSLAISPEGGLLFLTVKRPLDKQHPDYREGATDTVIRVDLEKLSGE